MLAILALLLLVIFPLPGSSLAAEPAIRTEFCASADRTLAWVEIDIPQEYHAYGHQPGPSGMPTDLDFVLEGSGKAHIFYPPGTPEPDSFDKTLTTRIYRGTIGLLASLPNHAGGKFYAASLSMLLCSDSHCLPYEKKFTGNIPELVPPLSKMSWQDQAKALLKTEGDSSGALSLEEGAAPPARSEPPLMERRAHAPQPEKEAAAGDGFDLRLSPREVSDTGEMYFLGQALLLGLVAGLILNAMPCVLPVLTIKVSGLLLMGNASDSQKIRDFRLHNFCFAAGILTLFTCLALVLGAADLMWGKLFQSEALLLAVLLLVFLMGLSMLGVFTLPAFDLRIGENSRNPGLKAFCAGLVSTFLATPCSGPLLGGVLAWAFTQPLPVMVSVFWSVGLGMGLPYIVFGICPGVAKLLPRPGAWMLLLERVLGFLLLATALYLVYVLPSEKRMAILVLLLIASFCAWLWGQFCEAGASRFKRLTAGVSSVFILAFSFFWALQPGAPGIAWSAFSPDLFASQLGHKEMLVEFTADWCPNCKFLEASVLTEKNLRALQKKYGFELIRVDLTRSNPEAESLLTQLGSRSIPLTALFPAGPQARQPIVLRDLYSTAELKQALSETFQEERRSRALYGLADKD